MAGGEDEEGSRTVSKQPIFPPYGNLPRPQHSDLYNTHPSVMDHKVPSPHGTTPGAYSDQAMKSSVGSPVVRSDPPATTADEPVTLPSADDEEGESYGEQMSEVLAKVGQEELAKTGPGSDSLIFAENLSTDPNMPVFMKRKRGRPRKHPQPEQRRREVVPGRRLGRPPKSSSRLLRVMQRKIKKEPVDGPLLVEQLLEEELVDHLPTQQSLATESDRDENAIRFTDVGNHLPLLVAGQHLCAVCLTRHGYRQSTGMRRTRATSFKRFTSVICRTCNKFLCVAPRADGRTCFDIYHTMKDFICSDVPEFNRKESGDSDIISAEFDDSPDLTEDANMLLQLLQVASGEINKLSDLDHRERKDSMDTSLEPIYPRNSVSQDGSPCTDLAAAKLNNATSNSDIDEHGTGLEEDIDSLGGGDGIGNPDRLDPGDDVGNPAKEKKTKPAVNDGQVEPLNLLLKVLKKHRVLSVSETHQLRLERRPRKYNMTNRNAQAYAMFNSRSPDDLTRKYRRKSQYGNTGAKLKQLLTKFTVAERHIKSKPKPSTAVQARRPRKITPKKHMYVEDLTSSDGDDANENGAADASEKTSVLIRVPFRRKPGRPTKHPLKPTKPRKRHGCSDCNVTFWTPARLQEHQRIHTGERPYECDRCDMKFMRAPHLKKHYGIHVKVKSFLCDDCGKTFANNACLKEHMYTHSGLRPHKCPNCEQSFTRKQSLAEHLRMHTGEKPFSCKQCDSKFIRKSQLRAHMLFHTGEKPFLCQTCGSKFRFKAAFNEHVRIHTGSKPFVCQHCGTAFTGRTTLKRHIRLHTGEKPYKCTVCGMGFVQRTSLMCHIKKHPGMTLPSRHVAERTPKGKGADVCLYPVVGRRKRSNQGPSQQQQPLPHAAPISSHMELLMSDSDVSQTNSMRNMHMDDTSMSNEPPPHGDNSHHHQPQTDHLRMAGDHTSHLPMSSAAWSHDLPTQVPTFPAYDQNAIHRSHQMSSQPFAGFLPMPSQMPPAFPDQQRFPLDYRFSMN